MIQIGKVVSSHGIHGDVIVALDISNPEFFVVGKAMLIELLPGSRIPFFIETIKHLQSGEVMVRFEEIKSREASQQILNKTCFYHEDEKIQLSTAIHWDHLLNYEVINQDGQQLGKIENILSHGPLHYAEISYNHKTVTLPLHTDLILQMDAKKQHVHLRIAEGLLEL
ncbi:MAG: 16S rRNA processing protein RimM [Chitinophagaceae bacterium]|nr:16S rRNA processing protein RimM [Chitinophagaceae bacterium]